MITIREVAKAANVSVSTVSRVINNSPNVTREKRNRVMAAIEEVGYVPNVKVKKNRNAGSAKFILVITTIFHNALCCTIEETASEMGYEVLFKYTGEYDKGIQKKMDSQWWKSIIREDMLGGILLINPVMTNEMYENSLLTDYPVVQVGCSMRNFGGYTVSTDDFHAAYDMTRYLIEAGYQQIAIATSDDDEDATRYSYIKERYYGYRRALKDAGRSLEDEVVVYCDFSCEGGHKAAKKILAMEQRPDAVFCLCDRMAMGMIKELLSAGVRVPEDIAVAGFDGNEEGGEMTPSLTTVEQSFDDIATEAVQMLDQAIRGEISNGRWLFVAYRLQVRESTR